MADQKKMTGASGIVSTTSVGPFSPAVSNDDCRWEPGGTNSFTGTTVIVGLNTALHYRFAVRFPGVTVPQGKTIQSATLLLRNTAAQPAGSNTVSFVVSGYAADSPAMPLTTGALEAMTLTTANTGTLKKGPVTSGVDESIDVTNIIQELVNRALWASGNALILIARDDGTSTDFWNPEAFDNVGTNQPRLNITYVN